MSDKKQEKHRKFDVIIGNPPFQDETIGANKTYAPPIYYKFIDQAYELSGLVTLITPARFLFNAGSTPKDWNRKILSNPHFKVLKFFNISSEAFPNTSIQGGVAISLFDANKNFGSIKDNYAPAGIYIPFDALKQIMNKVVKTPFEGLSTIVYAPETYKFTDLMHKENPTAENRLSKGHKYDLKSSVFNNLPDIFLSTKPNDGKEYVEIYGLKHLKRTERYIRKDYVSNKINFENWKVLVPEANGSGAIGESIPTSLIGEPFVAGPWVGHTQTFISIGNFKNENEANALLKYIKTKFARVMLGILKVTQHNPRDKWFYVPMQDFTDKSDIDWSKSISEIDQQLYEKYGLSNDEIDFIETYVKEMD